MTNKQTIDGVSRELLERVREKLSQTDYTWSVGDPEEELRALLDAPAKNAFACWSCKKPVSMSERANADGNCPHCDVELDIEDWPFPSGVPAAQPQGEPVAWQYRIIEGSEPLFHSLNKDGWINTIEAVANDMAERPCLGKTRRYEVRKLYTEQPAPVAQSTSSDQYKAELYDEVWQKARDMGFANVTDALEEVAKLNGLKP